MVYEYDFVTWENYYGQLCKAYDRSDFAMIAKIVRELKDRHDTKVKHLVDDIKQGQETHKHLLAKIGSYDNLIEAIESQTADWDDLCDSNCKNGIHDKDCMTMKIRADVERVCSSLL